MNNGFDIIEGISIFWSNNGIKQIEGYKFNWIYYTDFRKDSINHTYVIDIVLNLSIIDINYYHNTKILNFNGISFKVKDLSEAEQYVENYLNANDLKISPLYSKEYYDTSCDIRSY